MRSTRNVWFTGTTPLDASQTAFLAERGVHVRHVPLIETRLTKQACPCPGADWLIVTSQRAVPALEGLPRTIKVAAVGEKTKTALERAGFNVVVTPERFTGEALVRALRPHVLTGERVLFARGNLANVSHVEAWREDYVDWVVYETTPLRLIEADVAEIPSLDGVVLLSPSAVEVFAPHADAFRGDWFAIGEVTARAIERIGHGDKLWRPARYTIEALLELIGNETQFGKE